MNATEQAIAILHRYRVEARTMALRAEHDVLRLASLFPNEDDGGSEALTTMRDMAKSMEESCNLLGEAQLFTSNPELGNSVPPRLNGERP